MQKKNPILILGLGNELLCDDAIGIRLVIEFKELYKSKGIDFLTSCNGGLEIVELISGYDMVVIIDAIKTRDGIPGSIYHFTPADFTDTLHVSSFHDISFLTALKLAAYTEMKIPEHIHIIAIEIVEDLLFSNEFSETIAKKYNDIKKKIKEFLDQIYGNENPLNCDLTHEPTGVTFCYPNNIPDQRR